MTIVRSTVVLADKVERLLSIVGDRNFVASNLELTSKDARVDEVILRSSKGELQRDEEVLRGLPLRREHGKRSSASAPLPPLAPRAALK